MKITFIRPNLSDYRAEDAMEPLVFGILSYLTPDEYERVLYDDRIEEIPFEEPTDLVVITVETFTAKRAYQIADRFRLLNVPVIMGGFHPTFMPEEAKLHADSVVIGDAEDSWEEVLEDFKTQNLKPFYRPIAPIAKDTQFVSGVDRKIFQNKGYHNIALVQLGRGCRFYCDFCSIKAFYHEVIKTRSISSVISEIEMLDTKNVSFVDDNLFRSEKELTEFLEALIPLKIRWVSQMSIDVTQNEKLLKLFEKSGCMTSVVGFESLSPDNLKQMRKDWAPKKINYVEALKRFRDHGIMVYGTFVFGYDWDTLESFDEVLDFALDNKLMIANFNPLTPTPGTTLYSRLEKEGKLLFKDWWLHPDYRYGMALFKPKHLQAQELTDQCFRIRSEFNSFKNIFARSLDFQANSKSWLNMKTFYLSNYVSRNEIFKKQGLALGFSGISGESK